MSNLHFIHSDRYADVIELSKKFVSNNLTRPILLFVEHKDDGSIVATDSIKALIVNNIHGFTGSYLVNPKTLEFATGKYPDTKKMMSSDDYKRSITLNQEHVRIWLQMHRSMNQMFKTIYRDRNNVVAITITADKANFEIPSPEDGLTYSLPFEEIISERETIHYNNESMRDALHVFEKLKSKFITISFSGKLTPILLSDGEDISVLITPVRVL
ncbi:hypothetical protein ACM26V_00250 [Salipaludibacillus sp. HK11]|uniref:hypothetical protein n=1 Tax=Salipaludibacillus sp. HK11 TaxID=3394320 RepID=UPI0039FDC511